MKAYCPHCGKKYRDIKHGQGYCDECDTALIRNVVFIFGLVVVVPRTWAKHMPKDFRAILFKMMYVPKHSENFLDKLAKPVEKFDIWIERVRSKLCAWKCAAIIFVESRKRKEKSYGNNEQKVY